MSLHSFITFAREADVSCVKSRVDKSKMVAVKDLKGTKWEKNYLGLPDDMRVYLGCMDDLQELNIYAKYPNAIFNKVFDNPFVYSMNARFKVFKPEMPSEGIEVTLKMIEKFDGVRVSKEEYLNQWEETAKKAKESDEKYVACCRQQLYEVVKFNTSPGEMVEIYSGWDSGMTLKNLKHGLTKEELAKAEEKFFKNYKAKFGPPKETRVIDLEDVLTSELLDLQDKVKIEIHKL